MLKYLFISVVFMSITLVTACDDSSSSCGNGTLDENEECDGTILPVGQDCYSLGFNGGVMKCSSNCKLDISSCEETGKCGDGTVNDGFEQCEGDDLNGKTCESLGYPGGGELTCNSSCQIDVSGCSTDDCGNSVIEGEEECDGYNLNGKTCSDYGYYGGVVICNDDCTINSDDCLTYGFCGDGEKQTMFEECDGTDFLSTTCEDFGYHDGTLVCTLDCTVDYSDCVESGSCGDSIVQDAFEDCDATNLNNQDCVSLGYTDGGSLACGTNCEFDTSGCAGFCGDGILQYPGEECEADNYRGLSCTDFGYSDGPLACDNTCNFVFDFCVE